MSGMVEISLDHLSLNYLAVQDCRVVEPIRYQALCDRARSFMQAQRWNAALNTANRAIGLDCERYEGWMLRANALLMLERLDEALLSCDRASALNHSPKVVALRGMVLHRLGHYEEAYNHYRQAIGRKSTFQPIQARSKSFWQNFQDYLQAVSKRVPLLFGS
jgi:tetratricopeptide (TPR) repeat protein